MCSFHVNYLCIEIHPGFKLPQTTSYTLVFLVSQCIFESLKKAVTFLINILPVIEFSPLNYTHSQKRHSLNVKELSHGGWQWSCLIINYKEIKPGSGRGVDFTSGLQRDFSVFWCPHTCWVPGTRTTALLVLPLGLFSYVSDYLTAIMKLMHAGDLVLEMISFLPPSLSPFLPPFLPFFLSLSLPPPLSFFFSCRTAQLVGS